jgi:hypothetical protein
VVEGIFAVLTMTMTVTVTVTMTMMMIWTTPESTLR